MTNREWAAFLAMAALIFPAFAPADLLSGKIVAVCGFAICGIAALVLYLKPDRR